MVMLTAFGKVQVQQVAGRQSQAWIGISDLSSSNSTFIQLPPGVSPGVALLPFSVTRTLPINAGGNYTFALFGQKIPGSEVGGGVAMDVLEPNFTALFVGS